LFHALYFNDLPYNLAPSLHISLRSLVWVFYGAHLTGWVRRGVKIWFILIGLSTLLLWQHHLVDVASGFVMGWVIAALIPDPRQLGTRNPSRKYALRYGAGALACAGLGLVSIVFVWPAVACGIVSLAYATGLSRLLGKENGTLSPSAEWCLLPVILGTAWVQRKWLKHQPARREG
jgi:dolichol kinase